MTFNFVEKVFSIGGSDVPSPLQFYKRGFRLGNSGGIDYKDIILSGNTALTLVNSKADGLNYLKLFGATEQRNIPSGYTQVEYLESDGNQYIDTGVTGYTDIELDIKYRITQNNTAGYWAIYGRWDNDNSPNLRHIYDSSFISLFLCNNETGSSSPTVSASSATPLNTDVVEIMNTDGWYINNTFYARSSTSVRTSNTNSILLFNRYARSENGFIGRVYYFVLKRAGTVLFNGIPCKRNSDNVLGMYDTVSNTFLTNAGTGSFIAGADVTTPSPDYPMDIVCNNGAIKYRHQSGLPWGYTLLDYIESTGTQYIDTGYKPNTNTAISIKYYPAISSTFMCLYGTQDTIRSNRFYGLISSTQFRVQVNSNAGDTPNFWGINHDGTLSVDTNGTFAQTQGVVTLGVDNKNKVISVKSNEYTGDISASGTVLGDNLNCSYNLLLLARGTAGVAANYFKGRIYSFVIKDNNVLVHNLIPCRRNSDNVIGMYDLVSQTFFTNAGTGDFTAGNTVSDPIAIYADGTVETVEVHTKNLFNKNDIAYNNSTILADGSIISAESISVLDYIPVQPNTAYTYSSTTNSARAYNKRIVCFDANKNYITSIADTTGNPSGPFSITGTTPANTKYVRVACSNDQMATAQLELGSTATTYEPYFNGGQATAENLFKVGTYQDVQSVIDGGVIHRCGIKVLNGSEDWTQISGTNYVSLLKATINMIGDSNATCLMTSLNQVLHADINTSINCFSVGASYLNCKLNGYTSVTDFKQYLATQYNAGTPVIIVYPLATPTVETVEPQPMNIQAGTNIVEITQASMDNLELEVSYKATV